MIEIDSIEAYQQAVERGDDMPDPIYNAAETARTLRVSRHTLLKMRARGEITPFKTGREALFTLTEIDRAMSQRYRKKKM